MQKILIIAPNWIGDAVMTLPLVAYLQQKGGLIDVLAPKIVSPIYKFCQNVENVIEHNLEHKKLNLKQRLDLIKIIKSHNYDIVYILPNSLKSLIIPLLSSISKKIAYTGEWPRKYFLSSYKNNKGKKLSMVKHYYALANDSNIISEQEIYPKMHLDIQKAKQYSKELGLYNYIVIAIGAEYGRAKQWPIHHFKSLIQIIYNKYPDLQIVLLGSDKDLDNAKNLEINKQVINLCGKTSLSQAILILKDAQQLLTHDSGLMHIACAVGTKVLAIYGSTSPYHTPPLSNNSSYIWLNLSCSPCFERTCPLGHYACLESISPIKVFEKMFQS